MGFTDSDYPSAIDPEPVDLLEEVDYIPANALQLIVSQVGAVQGAIGNDPTLFTALGAGQFGAIGALLLALFRIESGTVVLNGSGATEFPVAFTDGRFSAPPFVYTTRLSATSVEPTQFGHYGPKNITSKGFFVGASNPPGTTFSGITIMWFAFQSPFGVESKE